MRDPQLRFPKRTCLRLFGILRCGESIATDLVFPNWEPISLSTRRSERLRLSSGSNRKKRYGKDKPR